MTISEIDSLYARIFRFLYQMRIKEAIMDLGYLIQQNGFGPAYDELVQQETTYRYLLRYRLEGVEDKERDKVLLKLIRTLCELADSAYRQWLTVNSSQWYYSRLRAYRSAKNTQEVLEELRELDAELALTSLKKDEDQRKAEMLQLNSRREQLSGTLFQRLLLSDIWSDREVKLLQEAYAHLLYSHEKALLVSALLLSLQFLFDEKKFLFLLDLCEHEEVEVNRRALTAVMLLFDMYDRRMQWYPAISSRLAALLEDEARQSALLSIFIQLARTKDVDTISRRMQEEFLPEMSRLGSSIQQKITESQEFGEELNPDWKELFEDASLSEKMQEFSEMQIEGVDVYMSTFSNLKFYPFFKEIHNWFLPFYSEHSQVAELFKHDSLQGVNVTKLVTSSDFLCSSDKYSFCFNLAQVPETYRSQMAANLGSETEAYQELQKMEQSGNQCLKTESVSNRYIQDLYRFYKLFSHKKDFKDVFAGSLDFYAVSGISPYLEQEEIMLKVALVYFKTKHYRQALKLFDRLLENKAGDADLHRKKAYCHQQLQEYAVALQAYLKADLLQHDNLWTLKRISACYRQLKNNEEALVYYRRAEKLDPENYVLSMNIGHCLMDLQRYNEALQSYYKAEFISGESPRTWRPLVWCAIMCKKYDQAGKYVQKLLAHKPVMVDFLNAGHLEWLQGSALKAIQMYKKGIRLTHTAQSEFFDLFEKDLSVLLEQGINSADIPMVRDGLLYQLEE